MSDLFTPNQIEGLVIIGLTVLLFVCLFVDGGRETSPKIPQSKKSDPSVSKWAVSKEDLRKFIEKHAQNEEEKKNLLTLMGFDPLRNEGNE